MSQPPADSFEAVIVAVDRATPSVNSYVLSYGAAPFRFRAGQWIDLYVELEEGWRVGGYSMTSSPLQRGRIQLAVKRAAHHPVTRWLHERARVGARVRISNGQGEFVFERGMAESVVLLGGGIGVTPLVSIFRYIAEAAPEVRAILVHSVPEPDELIFRWELERLTLARPGLTYLPTVTRDPRWTGRRGRIDAELLRALGDTRTTLYYYCGGREFIESMTRLLLDSGVEENRLRYEKWW